MATAYSDLTPGTAITWTNTGGTKALNAKALTNTSIRQGDKSASLIDGTKGMPEVLRIVVETKVQSAPTAGTTLDLHVGFSASLTAGTGNPGGLTGADGTGPNVDVLTAGQVAFVGSVVMSNNLGTGVQRGPVFEIVPRAEYMIPVLYNQTGQTTSNVDGETVITVTPWYRRTPIA
jgi:hypothetical protein